MAAVDLRAPLAASAPYPAQSPQVRHGQTQASPADPAPVPRAPRWTHSQRIFAGALGLVGLLAVLTLGLGLTVIWSTRRTTELVAPAPLTPASTPPAPPGPPTPRDIQIIHRGTDALESNRLLAATLDPALRACVDLAARPLGQSITYSIYINADGTPSRLERMYGVASPEETACIEGALMASRWPPRLSTHDPAVIILAPVY